MRGVTTGISAHDRAKTISVAVDPKRVEMISFHQARLSSRRERWSTLVRAGHTEAVVDIARLEG